MATQPATTKLWCTDTTDPESNTLKVEPPQSIQDTGLLRNTPFARIWHNFYFNYLCTGLAWVFDDAYAIGRVVSFETAQVPTFATWRGTWTSIGSQTIGSTTVDYYERTA